MVDAVAEAAEAAGFATLWVGEHVVMVDQPASRYPYNEAGQMPVPADADWLDPFVCLSFAAAATDTIRLATGILLLPEHNPVLVAKQAATLDVMCGGRFTLGVGIGWSREEFTALGVPFAHRGERTVEYVRAIREIWRADRASFSGRFIGFDSIRVSPSPYTAGACRSCSGATATRRWLGSLPTATVVRLQPGGRRCGARSGQILARAVRASRTRSGGAHDRGGADRMPAR